jgi:hypothetical protein
MVDVMMKVALFADVAGLATAIAGLCEGFEGSSGSTSIGILGGSMREGACIAAGVVAVGGCEQMKENGVRWGTEYVIGAGAG